MEEKKLLLISYHFGRDGSTGGFRWYELIPHLHRAGWTFDVITRSEASAPAGVDRLIRVERPAAGEAFNRTIATILHKAKALVRREPGSPNIGFSQGERGTPADVKLLDPTRKRPLRMRVVESVYGVADVWDQLAWSRAVARHARDTMIDSDYAAVVVSSPPHFTQMAGVRLSRKLGIPYVADFRDPWVRGLDRYASYLDPARRLLGRIYERKINHQACAVIHNTEWAAAAVSASFGGRSRPARYAVPNGYDADPARIGAPDPDRFRICFTGWIHPYMDIRVFLAACGRFRTRHALPADAMKVAIVGSASEFGTVQLSDLAAAYGIGDCFEWRPRMNREDVAEIQGSSAVLCAFDYPHKLAIVMKFYDYLPAKGRLLLVGNPEGALADAGAKVGARVYHPTDSTGIDEALDEAYAAWREGRLIHPVDRSALFHRSRAAEAMADALGQVTG